MPSLPRRALLAAPLAGCAPEFIPAGPALGPARHAPEALTMPDGARLPLRSWVPEAPRAVLLALHGFNDSRNFMAEPAPALSAAGVAVHAYDQRGFGGAPNRGVWPGAATLAADAAEACRLMRALHPGLPLLLLGESMGGAVILVAAAGADPPPADRLVLLAPAVWGKSLVPGLFVRFLEVLAHTVPRVAVASGAPGLVPTDNPRALERFLRDPLTIRETRFDATLGLFGLMDAALEAGARLGPGTPPTLLVAGGRDRFVPPVATRAFLHRLPPDAPLRVAFYPGVLHMPLRDLGAGTVIADLLAWAETPGAPLPSGADAAGAAWARETG